MPSQLKHSNRRKLRNPKTITLKTITQGDTREVYTYNPIIESINPLSEYKDYLESKDYETTTGRYNSVKSIGCLICWTYYTQNGKNIYALPREVMCWTKLLLTKHINLIRDYCLVILQRQQRLQPSTITKFLYDCMKDFALWFRTIRRNSGEICRIPIDDADRLDALIQSVLKLFRNRIRRDRFRRTQDQLVSDRRLPAGEDPFKVLVSFIEDEISEFEEIFRRYDSGIRAPITKDLYERFVNIFLGSIYLEKPQGRVGGLEALKVSDITNLLGDFGISHAFKTCSTYGIQPIILGEFGR